LRRATQCNDSIISTQNTSMPYYSTNRGEGTY
jgi:hypothetical protein